MATGALPQLEKTVGKDGKARPYKPQRAWANPSPAESSPAPAAKPKPGISFQKIVATIDDIIAQAKEFNADDLNDFGADLLIRAETLQRFGEEEGSS